MGSKGSGRRVGKWETASEPLTTESKDSWDVVLEPDNSARVLLLFLTLTSWLTELSLRIFEMEKKKFHSLGRCHFIPIALHSKS